MQKVDGVADGFTGSGQQTGTSVEQTVIAQSQHHQQFLGMLREMHAVGVRILRRTIEVFSPTAVSVYNC